ncbi:hypothetical protein Bpfe_010933 [Biomphalaria pfeifferi]|uniref:Uncharacterized protein n=1 Tax=Biomphalaria pfeifferi TaxID=112525 RepID=A0AAD8FCW1_BIOPF|nr:hypothetical protein Bpfe_010933 [Biomphalaria pfeifferi]
MGRRGLRRTLLTKFLSTCPSRTVPNGEEVEGVTAIVTDQHWGKTQGAAPGQLINAKSAVVSKTRMP